MIHWTSNGQRARGTHRVTWCAALPAILIIVLHGRLTLLRLIPKFPLLLTPISIGFHVMAPILHGSPTRKFRILTARQRFIVSEWAYSVLFIMCGNVSQPINLEDGYSNNCSDITFRGCAELAPHVSTRIRQWKTDNTERKGI